MAKAAILDSSIQKTHEWLNQVGDELGFDNEHAAYAALRATLHTIRDRLPVELVAHFGAELPLMVRGIYYDGWHPSAARLKESHSRPFCESMRHELQGHNELQHVEDVARSVLRVLDQRLDPGQIGKVVDAMPEEARRLWRGAH